MTTGPVKCIWIRLVSVHPCMCMCVFLQSLTCRRQILLSYLSQALNVDCSMHCTCETPLLSTTALNHNFYALQFITIRFRKTVGSVTLLFTQMAQCHNISPLLQDKNAQTFHECGGGGISPESNLVLNVTIDCGRCMQWPSIRWQHKLIFKSGCRVEPFHVVKSFLSHINSNYYILLFSFMKVNDPQGYPVLVQFKITVIATKSGVYTCKREVIYPPPFTEACYTTDVKVNGKTHNTISQILYTLLLHITVCGKNGNTMDSLQIQTQRSCCHLQPMPPAQQPIRAV